MDNLNFYSNGIPAGQQTDSYSTQPGCLLSKNVDIFSSSKSIRATAWSEPSAEDATIVAQDGDIVLKTDGKVYEDGVEILNPASGFTTYLVSYTGKDGTYANAEFGTVKDMSVVRDGNDWQSIVIYTDRTQYQYSKTGEFYEKTITNKDSQHSEVYGGVGENGYEFTKNTSSSAQGIRGLIHWNIHVKGTAYARPRKIRLKATNQESAPYLTLSTASVKRKVTKMYYDAMLDKMVVYTPEEGEDQEEETIDIKPSTGSIFDEDGILLEVPAIEGEYDVEIFVKDETPSDPSITSRPYSGTLYIDLNKVVVKSDAEDVEEQEKHIFEDYPVDYQEMYGYLPIRDYKLIPVGIDYWVKGNTFQTLYKWMPYWVDNSLRYVFEGEYGWTNEPGMDIVSIISWNERFYMIGNLNGNGYIIPCTGVGTTDTPYVAYGMQFFGAINKDYIIYLVGEDRGVSTLWVFNGQQLVTVLSGSEESDKKNLIDTVEQYRFAGSMCMYRDKLILSTKDNRLFEYGQTYGGRGGSFIHVLPNGATLKEVISKGNDLKIKYTHNNTDYTISYLDDNPIKRYNTEYEVVYPINVGNHLLEKEETDLYVSYILPSSLCKLEFRAMSNHYHFRTFTAEDNVTLSTTESYKMSGCTGNYVLKFLERNGNQYTFVLEGDLPVQTTSEMKIKDSNNTVVLNYTSFNHFRRIGTVESTGYEENHHRFHGINNLLDMPRTYSIQVMARGKGTVNYTPELFALNLVATQRDRG